MHVLFQGWTVGKGRSTDMCDGLCEPKVKLRQNHLHMYAHRHCLTACCPSTPQARPTHLMPIICVSPQGSNMDGTSTTSAAPYIWCASASLYMMSSLAGVRGEGGAPGDAVSDTWVT
jgi:hypothetical protein